MSFLPVGAAAVPLTALVATLHPLNQTWLVLHPSERWRGRGTHRPPAAQRPGLPDQPKARLQLPDLPPFHLLQPWLCRWSRSRQGKGILGLWGERGTGQGVVAQRGASLAVEDAIDVQGLSPGPPGWPVAASRRTKHKGVNTGCYRLSGVVNTSCLTFKNYYQESRIAQKYMTYKMT